MAHLPEIDPKAIEYPEGPGKREVCKKTVSGRREYRRRVELMWWRQDGLCCLCAHPLRLDEATFEHAAGRGMGGFKRDDRVEIDGQPINGAAHGLCNAAKGSRKVEYLIPPRVTIGLELEMGATNAE